MKYNHYLILFTPIFVYISLIVFYKYHNLIYVVLVLVFLSLAFTTRQFVLEGKSREKWWNFLILPACFTVFFVVFCTMMPDIVFFEWTVFKINIIKVTLIKFLFLLNSFFLYHYFRLIYCYLVKRNFYREKSLENFSAYGNFLAFYFLISSIYGLESFLNVSIGLLMVVMSLAAALLSYEVFWINGINMRRGFLYILFICLVLLEITWSASFLTLSYYILGLIIAVCYYVLIGLTKFYLLGIMNKKIIKLYLSFSLASIFVILLTARWM